MFLPVSRLPLVRWLESFAGALTSVAFPAGCLLCDALLTHARRIPLCETCLASFQRIAPPICRICGQPLPVPAKPGEGEPVCRECVEGKFGFQLARSFGVYEGALARAIVHLKYERIEPLGSFFAKRLLELVRSEPRLLPADVIVPVPLHRQSRKDRGYNQVDLFARPLARRLHVPYRPILLMRSRPRPSKHLLRQEERWEAVRGAFVMRRGGRVDNLRVLLLDDVMTTGATLDACARALCEAGARSVLGLTIARAARPAFPVSGA
jgi:ComF family protein